MFSQPFHDPSVVADLLTVCQGEGWMSPAVQAKTQIMMEQGLHPEQVFIGTGIVSTEQYGEALSRLFDVPFVRKTPAAARHTSLIDEQTLARARAFVADRDPSSALVAFADPSDTEALQTIDQALQKKGISLVPAVTLWSDLRTQHATKPHSAASLRRNLEHSLARSGTSTLELGHVDAGWYVHHQGLSEHDTAWQRTHASTATPALAVHLKANPLVGWRVQSTPTTHGTMMRFEREEPHALGVHPLDWSQSVQRLMSEGQGVLVIIHADKAVESLLANRFPQAEIGTHWRTSMQQPHVYRVRGEEEREEVLHAVLSGRSALILQQNNDVEWLRVAPVLGIRISRLERCATPEGAAWISYDL
jgi:hypothetical protein